ncbi:MAG: PUA domain-containing protein [Desulfurococcaceae archaeon]|jgi:16S rRNA (cytosine967-C5)-methyltransferase
MRNEFSGLQHEVKCFDEELIEELRRVYASRVQELLKLLRRPPSRLYARVNTLKTTRANLIRELEEEGVEAYPDEHLSDAIYFRVEGPYEFECSGEKVIVVDEQTAVSVMLGADLYRPGIVKMPKFAKGEALRVVTRRGELVACVEAAVSSDQARAIVKGLIGVNIGSPYKAPKIAQTRAYAKGLLHPQSAPSIVTSHVLSPKEGMLVLDMNASPGGKTGHIVQLTRGRALIVAVDRSEKKVAILQKTLERLGLNIGVLAIPGDSRYAHIDLNIENKADRVLIDPPCSNLGVRPLLGCGRKFSEVLNLANYQRQFLRSGYYSLKKGGLLVYSTCTLTLKENEENILYAVEELGLHPVELPETPPYAEKVSFKGITAYRFSPFTHDMPGYFIAVLTK